MRRCVAAGCNNLVSLDLVYFGFQIHHFVNVGKNKFVEHETAGKVQQSTMEFAAVTSKNTVLRKSLSCFKALDSAARREG